MADEDEDLDDEGDADEEDGSPSEKGGKNKLLIVVALVIFLVVGGVAGAYFTGLLDPIIAMIVGEEIVEGDDEITSSENAVFYDVGELLVNLNTGGRKSSFLKIRMSLELEDPNDIQRIESIMPRIIDNFQTYLRELRIEDLKGSAGMYRLREELLARASAAAAPVKVSDVLFKEMLVQ
ncbi:MAG: flagellar basal body-associated FliL family protein [Pseudomonadota bacterium]|nr:flagellar basal body-associated FliL family protein [Pseudomonadota bacterium]